MDEESGEWFGVKDGDIVFCSILSIATSRWAEYVEIDVAKVEKLGVEQELQRNAKQTTKPMGKTGRTEPTPHGRPFYIPFAICNVSWLVTCDET